MCPTICPYDSALVVSIVQIPNKDAQTDTTTLAPKIHILPGSNATTMDTTIPPTTDDQLAVETKVKRAVEAENDNVVIPSINYQSDERMSECCAGQRCECDYTKCKQTICDPHQYKNLERPGSNKPGECCPIYSCSDERHAPSCYSRNHKRHYSINDTWNEDDCTQCTCNDLGEPKCRISVCKVFTCEKKIHKKGECCPECDWSGTKYCVGHEACDIYCRNGFEVDSETGCNICRCAKIGVTSTTIGSITTGHNATDERTISETTANGKMTEDNLMVYLPIMIVICVSLILFLFIVGLTCRYINKHKDKHRLNLKHTTTPLI